MMMMMMMMMLMTSGGSRGGTLPPPPPLFWVKNKIAEGRKPGRASRATTDIPGEL